MYTSVCSGLRRAAPSVARQWVQLPPGPDGRGPNGHGTRLAEPDGGGRMKASTPGRKQRPDGEAEPAVAAEPGAAPTAPAAPLYEALRSDVLAGTFGTGEVLQETTLADRYQVSRTPVRESLARLEHDGLVERVGRGYRVKSGTPEDVLEIYEARIALEAQAALGAADRRTALDLARLHHLHDLAGASQDAGLTRALNSEWHVVLWQAAHNRTIEALLARLIAQLRIYDRGSEESADDLELTHREPADVAAAIENRDGERAGALIAAHLTRSRSLRMDRFARISVDSQ